MAKFNQLTFDIICQRMAEGQTLRKICAEPDMPNITTVWKWANASSDLGKQYAHAREAQADAQFERIGDIVDDVERGRLEPAQARTMIDALKWTAGKLRPKVYGDKAIIEGPGENGEHLHKMSPDAAFAAFAAALGGNAPGAGSSDNSAGNVEGEGTA